MTEVKFTPLCSSRNDQCYCFLLSIGEDNILLDCGWTPEFCLEDIKELDKIVTAKTPICAILLSQPDIAHMGALPYVYGKEDFSAPTYCPLPLRNEGIYLLANELISKKRRQPFDLFSEEDIRKTIKHFLSAGYEKKNTIESKNGLSITVHKAGNKIGGSVWVITNKLESIVYAVSYNDRNEILLNSFNPDTVHRPWMLITDISNTGVTIDKRSTRDTMLQDAVSATLLRGGNVLLPVNSSSRWLELALVLRSSKKPPPLYLLSYSAEQAASYKYLEYLRQSSHLSDEINASDPSRGGDPLRLLDSASIMHVKSLNEIRDKAACVLASGPDLSSGFSKDLFLKWCNSPSNTVIFTDRATKRSLTRKIIDSLPEKSLLEIPVWVPREEKADILPQTPDDDDDGDSNGDGAVKSDGGMVLDDGGDRGSESSILRSSNRSHSHIHDSHSSLKSGELKKCDYDMNPLLTEFDATPESFRMAGMQYAMFPSDDDFAMAARREDRKAKGLEPTVSAVNEMIIDDYGMVIDPAEYMVKEEALYDSMLVESPLFKELKAIFQNSFNNGISYEKKVISVTPACNLCFIDFEGRAGDPREIIKEINPLNLILVNGDDKAIKDITEDVSKAGIANIHAPGLGEHVVVRSNMYMHKISVEESTCPTNYPTFVDMMVDDKNKFTIMERDRPWHDTVMLTEKQEKQERQKGRKEIFEVLRMHGYPVYYDDSDNYAIICNCPSGSFVIRVPEDNITEISFEGPLCDEYFLLKDLIYRNYKIV